MNFSIDGQTVWQPSSGVGRLYVACLTVVEQQLELSAGASATVGDADDIQIPSQAFIAFVFELRQIYSGSNHGIFRRLLGPVLFPAVVMLQRAGHGRAIYKDDPDQRDQIAVCAASMAPG